MDRKIIYTAAIFGLTAVILGAFGAHALKNVLSAQQIMSFETGVRYQFYHTFLLLFLGCVTLSSPLRKRLIFTFTSAGIVLFSGSIYLLSTDHMNDFNFKAIGFITPVGGLLLIIAWLLLFIDFLRKKS